MDLASLIIGIIGATASLVGVYLVTPGFANWRTVRTAVKKIAKNMSIDGFHPEIVVMYGRGGAIFGGLLAGNIGNLPVVSIDREVLDSEGTTETRLIHTNALANVKNRKVLMVTGEVATGNQLAAALRAVKKSQPSELKSASYYVVETSSTYPNYYYRETKSIIDVPWRFWKSYRRTSKRGLNTPM